MNIEIAIEAERSSDAQSMNGVVRGALKFTQSKEKLMMNWEAISAIGQIVGAIFSINHIDLLGCPTEAKYCSCRNIHL